MKAKPRATNPKRVLPLLGALLFFSSLLLLSCGDLSDDDPAPKFSIAVFAGDGTPDYKDGQGTDAHFFDPSGITVASDGTVYVADQNNHRIRKITPDGLVSTLAGNDNSSSFDGKGTAAEFASPYGIAVASDGMLYVADSSSSSSRIRKITPDGTVTTPNYVESGTTTTTQFNYPYGVAVASDGTLYVADTYKHRIRKITTDGEVTAFAGDGTPDYKDGQGTDAKFSYPYGVAVASGGTVYVADSLNNRIRKITAKGEVTTFAGDGTRDFAEGQGTDAKFHYPYGIAVASDGTVYVADTNNDRIRKITPDGTVTSIVKDLEKPRGIGLSPDGSTAYITNTGSQQILKLTNLSRAGSTPLEITLVQSKVSLTSKVISPVVSEISLPVFLTIPADTIPADTTLPDGITLEDLGGAITLTSTSKIPGATPTWKVANQSIATVTPDGANAKLKGGATGTTTLTVTINGLRKTVKLTVTAATGFDVGDLTGGSGTTP